MKPQEKTEWSCCKCGGLLGIRRAGRVHVKHKRAKFVVRGRVMTVCPHCAELNEGGRPGRDPGVRAAMVLSEVRSAQRPRVQRPPTQWLAHAVRLVLGRRAFDRIFGRTMADVHLEWVEAHSSGDLVEAKRVKVRAVFCLLWTAVVYLLARVAVAVDDVRKIVGPKC